MAKYKWDEKKQDYVLDSGSDNNSGKTYDKYTWDEKKQDYIKSGTFGGSFGEMQPDPEYDRGAYASAGAQDLYGASKFLSSFSKIFEDNIYKLGGSDKIAQNGQVQDVRKIAGSSNIWQNNLAAGKDLLGLTDDEYQMLLDAAEDDEAYAKAVANIAIARTGGLDSIDTTGMKKSEVKELERDDRLYQRDNIHEALQVETGTAQNPNISKMFGGLDKYDVFLAGGAKMDNAESKNLFGQSLAGDDTLSVLLENRSTYGDYLKMYNAYPTEALSLDLRNIQSYNTDRNVNGVTPEQYDAARARVYAATGIDYGSIAQQSWGTDNKWVIDALIEYRTGKEKLGQYMTESGTLGKDVTMDEYLANEDYYNQYMAYVNQQGKKLDTWEAKANEEIAKVQAAEGYNDNKVYAPNMQFLDTTNAKHWDYLEGRDSYVTESGEALNIDQYRKLAVEETLAALVDAGGDQVKLDALHTNIELLPELAQYGDIIEGLPYLKPRQKEAFFAEWNQGRRENAISLLYTFDYGADYARVEANETNAAIEYNDANFFEKVGKNIESFGQQFMSGIVGLSQAAQSVFNPEELSKQHEYSEVYDWNRDASLTRGLTRQEIEEKTQWADIGGLNVLGALYSGAMSGVDSAIIGAAASVFGPEAAPYIASVAMGSQTFVNERMSKLEQGYSEEEATRDAFVKWGMESGSEFLPFANMLGSSPSAWGKILKGLAADVPGEVLSEAGQGLYDEALYGTGRAKLAAKGYGLDGENLWWEWIKTQLPNYAEAAIGSIAGQGATVVNAVAENRKNRKIADNLRNNDGVDKVMELAETLDLSEPVKKIVERYKAERAEQAKNEKAQAEEKASVTKEDADAFVQEAEKNTEQNARDRAERADEGKPGETVDPAAITKEDAEQTKKREQAARDRKEKADKKKAVTDAELGYVYREVMNNVDKGAQQTVTEAFSRDVVETELAASGYRGDMRWAADVVTKFINGNTGKNIIKALESNEVVRQVALDFMGDVQAIRAEYRSKAENIAQRASKDFVKPETTKAEKGAQEATQGIDDRAAVTEDDVFAITDEDIDVEIAEAEESTVDGKAVTIEGVAKVADDGSVTYNVKDADGNVTEVAEGDVAYGQNDGNVARLVAMAKDLGRNAETMIKSYAEGQSVAQYAKAFKQAMQYGEDGQNLEVVKGRKELSVLNEAQAKVAYEMGRGIRTQRNNEMVRKNVSGITVGTVDTSGINGVKLTDHQRKSVHTMSRLAKAVGFNIRFVESKANAEGKYTTENGSWDPRTLTLTLDVHAGSNSTTDTKYAMMHTAGHEMTHYIRQFADADLWNGYQEFVIGHLSKKTGEDFDLETEIANGMRRGLSRDAAIEEVIADASGEALNSITEADIQAMAETNPGLLEKVKQFFERWIKSVKAAIKAAYKGTDAKTGAAKQMMDAVDEMGKRWNEMLVNATKNRAADAQTAMAEDVASETTEAQPEAQNLNYRHIDQRTFESVKEQDVDLFAADVEEAQIGMAAAANMLLADLENSIPGQKVWLADGEVTGQKRLTSELLGRMKDDMGITWDKLRQNLQQFAEMEYGEKLPRNSATNRRIELYLHEMLTEGYTALDGTKVNAWPEYIDAVQSLEGADTQKKYSPINGAVDFVDYAWPGEVKYSPRYVGDKPVVWVEDNILSNKPADVKMTDYIVEYLTDHVGEMYTIIESGQHVFIGEEMPEEYVWSEYSKAIRKYNQKLFKAKGRAASGIGEAINIASNRRWEKTKHPKSKDAKYGMYRYDSRIAFPMRDSSGKLTGVKAYNVQLLIRNASDGNKYLYDVVKIKEDTITANNLYKREVMKAENTAKQKDALNKDIIHDSKPEVKKFSARRSDQTQTDAFKKWFKDSKIVSPDGSPKVMYHGTPYGGFTVFKDWQYFTDNEEYAGHYQEPSASSIRGRYNPATNAMTYAVYLNVKKPFDTRDPKIRKIWKEEFYDHYSRTPLSDKGLPDWTDGIDLVEFIEDNDYDYDAIILDEGAVGGYGDDVKSRGISVVVRSSNQIKSATDNIGTFDPDNPDINYQVRDLSHLSDRELLVGALDTELTEAERDHLERYKIKLDGLAKDQKQLEDLNEKIVQLRNQGFTPKTSEELRAAETNATTLRGRIDRKDAELNKIESAAMIKELIRRNRREASKKRTVDLREWQEKEKYRDMLEKDAKKLHKWLVSPTSKGYAPEFLRKPLGDFLEQIDFTSKRALRGGEETWSDEKFKDSLEELRRAIAQLGGQQQNIEDGAEDFMGYIDLPVNFVQDFDENVRAIKKALDMGSRKHDTPVNRMTAQQMREMSQMFRVLNSSIVKVNTLVSNGRYTSAKLAADDTINDLNEMKARAKTNKALELLNSTFNWKNTTPYYVFQRLGRGGKDMFERLMNGWDKMAYNSAKVIEYAENTFTGKEAREWSREITEVKLDSEDVIQMTTAQKMSLYCLQKRPQAQGHLLGGGIRISDIDGKRGSKITQADNYVLTADDIYRITTSLTERQREVADKLQEFMNTVCAEWGNEISMKRFGFRQMTELMYFPIETDSNNRKKIDESKDGSTSMFRLLNMSSLKPLVPKANNAIVIKDIFNVFSDHASDMAKYNALALPILDFIKWYNHVEVSEVRDDSGRVTGQITTRSTQKALERAFGTDAKSYLTAFVKDLNAEHDGGRNDGLINSIVGRAKSAAVGANLRVYGLQITSLPRAAFAINPAYLIKGMAKVKSLNPASAIKGTEAQENVGILKWKDLGFYSTDVARSTRSMVKRSDGFMTKVRDIAMMPAGWGDNWVSNIIYEAAKAELADTHKDLKPGTKAYEKALNDRVREIVYKTQVVDSTMTRSDFMRSKGLMSTWTAFMSEPTLTVNMLNEGIQKAVEVGRKGGNWRKELLNPKGLTVRAATVFAFTAVVTSLVESAFDGLRDDDEYERFMEKFSSAFKGNIIDNVNVFAMLPYLKDVISIFQGYENSSLITQGVQQWKDFKTSIESWQNGKAPIYRVIYNGMKAAGSMTGVGLGNATRDAASLYNTFFAPVWGTPKLQTYEDTESTAATAYYNAMAEGRTEDAAYYMERMQVNELDMEKVNKKLVSLAGDGFVAGNVSEADARKWLNDAGYTKDKTEDKIRDMQFKKETGVAYSDFKSAYVDGTFSKTEATRLLKKYRGYDDNKIYFTLQEWEGGEDWTKYGAFLDAVDNRSGYAAEAKKLLDHGVEKGDIASAIAKAYKEAYREIHGTQAGNLMLEYLLDVYEAIGYDRDYERKYITKNWIKD